MDITTDELMIFCMARQIRDGQTVAQGIATPMATAAYLLARRTHAPNLYFASAIGQGICRDPAPLGVSQIESLWLDRALTSVGFVRAAADILPTLRPVEFFRPGQVDKFGNFNNVAFGKNYLSSTPRKAKMRLPGTGGIPDVTTFISHILLYVPRHSRVTFVPKLDVRSGLGHSPERVLGDGAKLLVSNLGQFSFPGGQMQIDSYHPGVSIDKIKAHTGFELIVSSDVHETPLPGPEELRILREEIDPLGIRCLESLSGASRRQLLHEILRREYQVS
jgi:acyl CoA:acetate/3-ketoacid CoA transferase beta subunit